MKKDMEISPQDAPGIFSICPDQIRGRKIKKFPVCSYGSGFFLRTISQPGKSPVQIREIGIQLVPAVMQDPDYQIFPAFFSLPVNVPQRL